MPKKIHFFRARFAKEILAEFLPPARPSHKVIILCDGMPTAPSKRSLMAFFSRKGFWVFHPRYRGTWESRGQFLRQSPHLDILKVIAALPRGFTDILTKKRFRLKPQQLYLLGGSFGGAAIILASRDPRVTKGIAFCPVVDWKKITRISSELRVVKEAFGPVYRFSPKDWAKLASGKFYNPAREAKTIDGKKLLIIQARDDKSVAWRPVARFAKLTGAQLWLLKTGGHMSTTLAITPKFYKRIAKFISNRSRLGKRRR
jgi:hypothetical protein